MIIMIIVTVTVSITDIVVIYTGTRLEWIIVGSIIIYDIIIILDMDIIVDMNIMITITDKVIKKNIIMIIIIRK